MGKVCKHKVAGHWLYITSHCTVLEPPHIHSNKATKITEAKAGKIWVKCDGSSIVEKTGGASQKDLREIQEWIADNVAVMEAEWEALGGAWVWVIE